VNRKKPQAQAGVQHGNNKFPSISIIQVYGKANENSFKLNGDYITLDGSPYQYILRAYGPVIAPGMEYFDAQLVRSEQIWDFRLEGKINPNG
ncbi:hypothetical protein, partial [Bartonella sp. CL74QHWL]|uniref:hypothetical protein n=1 Tax=Bartonella sp. CL74QHWL TaxID=3243541 RepID=UPI0035D06976